MKLSLKIFPAVTFAVFISVSTLGVFMGGVWAIAGISGALILFVATWAIDHKIPRPSSDLAALAIIALAVMAISNSLSTNPALSWAMWVRLGTIFLPLMLFSSSSFQAHVTNPKLFPVMMMAALTGAAALGVELESDGALLKAVKGSHTYLTAYNRGLSYLVVLAFAILAWMRVEITDRKDKVIAAVFFILVLLIPASLTDSRAAKLALIVGLAVTAFAYFWPIAVRRFLGAVSILCLGWPFVAQWFFLAHYDWLKHFPDSWHARIEIWDYMSYRIMERPWLGWGLGTAHTLDFQNPHGAQYVFTKVAASHPHDAFVQLWVEMGVPGLALGVAFAFVTLQRAGRCEARLVPFALGAWAVGLCLALVAYSLWTDSLFAAFALTGFAFALLERRVRVV